MTVQSTLSSLHSGLRSIPTRWRERSLTALLVVQGATVFGVVPAIASGLPLPLGVPLFVLLVGMCATCLLTDDPWAPILGGIMFPLCTVTLTLDVAADDKAAQIVGEATGLLASLLLGIAVSRAVFDRGQSNGHRIRSSLVLYLNTGLSFSFFHRIVAETLPDAYDHVPSPERLGSFWAAIDYLSFSTLTALGAGEIIAVQPIARAASVLESTLGQLLPTVLIARAVMMAGQEDEPAKRKG